MKIDLTARGFTPSEKLQNFINEKLTSLEKYDPNISNFKVVLIKVVENGVEPHFSL